MRHAARSRGTLPLFRTVARRPSPLERAPAACTRPAVGLARESLDLLPERALIGPLHVAHLRREEVQTAQGGCRQGAGRGCGAGTVGAAGEAGAAGAHLLALLEHLKRRHGRDAVLRLQVLALVHVHLRPHQQAEHVWYIGAAAYVRGRVVCAWVSSVCRAGAAATLTKRT